MSELTILAPGRDARVRQRPGSLHQLAGSPSWRRVSSPARALLPPVGGVSLFLRPTRSMSPGAGGSLRLAWRAIPLNVAVYQNALTSSSPPPRGRPPLAPHVKSAIGRLSQDRSISAPIRPAQFDRQWLTSAKSHCHSSHPG